MSRLEEALTDLFRGWCHDEPELDADEAFDVLRSLADSDGRLIIDTNTGDVLRAEQVGWLWMAPLFRLVPSEGDQQ